MNSASPGRYAGRVPYTEAFRPAKPAMTYDPNKSSLHIIGSQRQPERMREEVIARPGSRPGLMPEVVIPHRGVTVRVIQGAMAHYCKEHPEERGIFRVILEGVCIAQMSIQTGKS